MRPQFINDLSPPVVLVVDDDPAIHTFLTAFLESKGHTVRASTSAAEAIRVLKSQRVDAIVLDVKMPGGSGLDVLRHVRGNPSLADTPVLILTGVPFTPDEESIVSSLRAYVFYKQENDVEELGSYLSRLTAR